MSEIRNVTEISSHGVPVHVTAAVGGGRQRSGKSLYNSGACDAYTYNMRALKTVLTCQSATLFSNISYALPSEMSNDIFDQQKELT